MIVEAAEKVQVQMLKKLEILGRRGEDVNVQENEVRSFSPGIHGHDYAKTDTFCLNTKADKIRAERKFISQSSWGFFLFLNNRITLTYCSPLQHTLK